MLHLCERNRKGESYVELAEEEAEALDKAIFHDIEKIEKSEIIEK